MDVDAAADDKVSRAAAPQSDSDVSSDSEDEAAEMDVIAEIRARLAEPMEDADDAAAASKGSLLVCRRSTRHALRYAAALRSNPFLLAEGRPSALCGRLASSLRPY